MPVVGMIDELCTRFILGSARISDTGVFAQVQRNTVV